MVADFVKEYFKLNLVSAMEYRVPFIIQVIGMAVNDAIWLAFWYFFFLKFENVAGWGFTGFALLFAIMAGAWGFCSIFFGNWRDIAKIIIEGKLDFYLTFPKDPLLHLLISKIKTVFIGDFLFGIILISILNLTIYQKILGIILIPIAGIILLAIAIFAGGLAFYIGSSEELSKTIAWSVSILSEYPVDIYTSFIKFILLFIFPIGTMATIPAKAILTLKPIYIIWTFLGAIFFLGIAILFFKKGLKKYESGYVYFARI